METLRNALGFFEEHGQMVVRKTKSGRQEAAMTLHPDWVPRYAPHHIPLLKEDVSKMDPSPSQGNYGIS